MNYFKFLLKKSLNNKFNLIPVLMLIVTIILMFILNAGTAKNLSLQAVAQNKLTQITAQPDAPADDKRQIAEAKGIISAANQGNWAQAYQLISKSVTSDLMVANDPKSGTPTELRAVIEHDYKMFAALKARAVPYQPAGFPTTGSFYSLWILQYLFPVVAATSVIFLVSSLFSAAYTGRSWRDRLFPRSLENLAASSIGAGFTLALGLLIGILTLSFTLGTAFYGLGSWNYPIESYQEGVGLYFQSLYRLVGPSLLLTALGLAFIVLLIYLLNCLLRDRLTVFLVSLVLIVAPTIATPWLEPVQKLARFLPTTYLNSVSVVSGQYAHQINNYSISFGNGLTTLGSGILLLAALIIVIQRKL